MLTKLWVSRNCNFLKSVTNEDLDEFDHVIEFVERICIGLTMKSALRCLLTIQEPPKSRYVILICIYDSEQSIDLLNVTLLD